MAQKKKFTPAGQTKKPSKKFTPRGTKLKIPIALMKKLPKLWTEAQIEAMKKQLDMAIKGRALKRQKIKKRKPKK